MYVMIIKRILALALAFNQLFFLDSQSAKPVIPISKTQNIEIVNGFSSVKQKIEALLPKSKYSLTPEKRDMLATLLYLEARGESEECQEMVMSLIFNRYDWDKWGDTFSEVVYAHNQFEPAHLVDNYTPTEAQYRIVDKISQEGSLLPPYVLYFRADYYHSWGDQVPYMQIDNTYFSYSAREKVKYENNN